MSILSVKVTSRKVTNAETFETAEVLEGTVTIPGLKASKLVKKSDNTTTFTSRSSLTSAAKNLAKNLGYEGVEFEETASLRKAAKKSN